MKTLLAVTISAVAAAGLVWLTASPATAAQGDPGAQRCFSANAGRHKTSLGAHQWTVRLETEWCVADVDGRPKIVSVRRSSRVRTGTNWRLISRSGALERDGSRRATAKLRAHFRLRYPYFEQNCYPSVVIEMLATGAFMRTVRTGC